MNPYAPYLDGREIVDILRATPGDLQALIDGLAPEALEARPAPGKWSPREIAAHLADTEAAFAFRLRQALEKPGSVITPFNQDVWALRYSAYAPADALRTFTALRLWNLALLTTVSEGERSNSISHPERGPLTFQVLLEIMAGHDLNHLGRLKQQIA